MKAFHVIPCTGFLLLCALLSGCALTQPKSKAELCTELKRQIIYNGTNLNLEARSSNAGQRDALVQRYIDNGCS